MKTLSRYSALLLVASLFCTHSFANNNLNKETNMQATGLFEVSLEPAKDDQFEAGRMLISKTYSGDMIATAQGQMISKRTSDTSVYSAIETVEATLDGKKGTFTLFHTGLKSATQMQLSITIVEGSGTGELSTISGEMAITHLEGKTQYTMQYQL